MNLFRNRLIQTTAMMRDPISLTAAGAAIASFLATPVGGLVLSAALSGASFLLQSALAPSGGSAIDPGTKQTLQAAIYEERLIYGRARVAGRIFFYECKPPYLYLGLEIASHEIDAIETVYINGVVVTFDGTGASSSVNFVNGTTPYAYMSARLGAAGQSCDPILSADFTEIPASTYKQQGHACVVMKCYYGSSADDHNKYWGANAAPKIEFLVRGMKAFDPRDATQNQTDSTTWKWSNSASLCMAHFMTYSRGMNRAWANIDQTYLIASANNDDQGISLANGTVENRYTINGVVNPNDPPGSTLQNMLTANLGDLIWSDGIYRFFSGVPKTAVWTLNDDSARGDMEVRNTRDRASLINTVRTVFASLDREYQTVNGPILNNAGYQTIDGEAHEVTITLPFTSSQTMAQRIAKATMEKSRRGKTITRRESLDALRLECADIINIDVAQLSALGGVFKLNKLNLDHETFEFEITAEEYSTAIYDWTVADEQPFTLAPVTLAGVN